MGNKSFESKLNNASHDYVGGRHYTAAHDDIGKQSEEQAKTWKRSAEQKASQEKEISEKQKKVNEMEAQQKKSDFMWGKKSPKPIASNWYASEPDKEKYQESKKELETAKKLNQWWRE